MGRMLVAYASCGCRIAALLSIEDTGDVRAFRREYGSSSGVEVRVEGHDSIGPLPCDKHRPGLRPRWKPSDGGGR